jgi:ESCRT-II complex subunit VPS22
MRRGPGLAALERSAHSTQAYGALSSDLSSASLAELRAQLASFSSALRDFAASHRAEILSSHDASFRQSFQQMCAALGVDPLASTSRGGGGGVWEALGLGEWTYALAVQIVDVAVSTRALNGGLIDIHDLCVAVTRLRTGKTPATQAEAGISPDDVARALKTLKPLGAGYELVALGKRTFVRTLPAALDESAGVLLALLATPPTHIPRDAAGLPYLDMHALLPAVPSMLKGVWTFERAERALDEVCSAQGLLWLDDGAPQRRYYSLAAVHMALE